MASTTIAKLFEPISNFMKGNKITLTNLVVTLVTVALNVLLDDDIFDCPQKDFKAYGYMFLIFPCVILLFANMMVIVTDWNPLNLLTVPPKDIVASVLRVFVAPIVWLIVSFAEADYYVCAKVGPNPDNKTGLFSMAEKDMLEQMMETTKTESQFIAWGLSVGMVLAIFLVICLCGDRDRRNGSQTGGRMEMAVGPSNDP